MPKSETLGTFFTHDHLRLDAIFAEVRNTTRAASKGEEFDLPTLRARYHEFHDGLDRHIRWEEEILFPAVEAEEPGLEHGPGRVMRMEHREIQTLLAQVDQLLDTPAPTRDDLRNAAQALEQTLAVLSEHNQKEEVVYYPTADAIFTPAQSAALLERITAMV